MVAFEYLFNRGAIYGGEERAFYDYCSLGHSLGSLFPACFFQTFTGTSLFCADPGVLRPSATYLSSSLVNRDTISGCWLYSFVRSPASLLMSYSCPGASLTPPLPQPPE